MQTTKKHQYWLMVVLLCGLAGSSIGLCNNCVGIFYTPVSNSLGFLRGTFAMHATISLLAMAAVTPFVPKMMQHVPYKRLLIMGSVVASLSTVGMAFSRQIWMFYLCGLLRGAGAAIFGNVPIMIVLTNWFHQKRGLASGITLSFSGLAGAAFSPFLTWCITEFGWSNAYLMMAVLIAACTLPAILFPFAEKPEKMGLPPYGETGAPAPVAKQETLAPFDPKKISLICLAVMTTLHTSITGIAQHFAGFAESLGMGAAVGALLMSLSMVGNIFTKLFIGVLSDRIGPVKACVTMIFVNATALVLFLQGSAAGSVLIMYIAAVCFGSIYSVGAVGISLMSRYFFGAKFYSQAYSIVGLLISVGSALSLPLIGYLYDFTGSYRSMLLFALGFHAIDLVLLFIVARNYKKDYPQE